MPNGKPGDHWYTDIVVHDLPVFSPEIAALIREIDKLVDDPAHATDPPTEPWEHPIRLRAEEIVEEHLDLDADAPERLLSGESRDSLERDLRAYLAQARFYSE